jgi:hypothetical protein
MLALAAMETNFKLGNTHYSTLMFEFDENDFFKVALILISTLVYIRITALNIQIVTLKVISH